MLEGKEYITRSKYDYFGKVIEIVYPNGQQVNYGYNAAGQLDKVGTSLNPEAYVKSINYTATGKRQKIVYGNGVETSYEYDPVRDAIKQIKTTKAGGEVLQDLTYSFDKVGNITGLANGADLGTTAYQYDSLDCLVVATASGFTNTAMNYSRTVGFANNGNILNKSDVGSYGWSPNVNQLLTVDNRSMVWDGVGNLSSRTILTNSESHLQQFSYDVHNNLSFFTNAHEFDGGGNWVKYSYDYSGQRLRRWSYSGNETIYPNKFYSIKNSKWTNNHIYAGKERICTLVNGEPSFIHRDQINSGGLITTNGGQVGDKITFAPYGEILYQQNTNASTGGTESLSNCSATPPLEEKFTGQILDPETGLYYYNARYYDPKIGIFISADTMIPDPYSSQDFNRYMYVKGNPVKYSNPTGHNPYLDRLFLFLQRNGSKIAEYARKGAKVGWKNIKAGVQFGARLASDIGNAGLSIARWATRSPFGSMANKIRAIRAASKASRIVSKIGSNDLVYGPSAGGKLYQLQQTIGGKLLTDLDNAKCKSMIDFSISQMNNIRMAGNKIFFDISNMKNISGILKGIGKYLDSITSKELRYIKNNWDAFRKTVVFLENQQRTGKPW